MEHIIELPNLDSKDLKQSRLILKQTPERYIQCLNWPTQFPYSPKVSFQIAHNGQELFILFTVKEKNTRALITENNGHVCQDSCVEFFISVDESGYYYNFEFSCIGTTMLGYRNGRTNAIYASETTIANIKRFPSLNVNPFNEQALESPWDLLVCIPITSLFKHSFTTWKGLHAKANFYKCGDALTDCHYLSWQPIKTEKPDFHTPQYFTPITFD